MFIQAQDLLADIIDQGRVLMEADTQELQGEMTVQEARDHLNLVNFRAKQVNSSQIQILKLATRAQRHANKSYRDILTLMRQTGRARDHAESAWTRSSREYYLGLVSNLEKLADQARDRSSCIREVVKNIWKFCDIPDRLARKAEHLVGEAKKQLAKAEEQARLTMGGH
jgi:hypothetical protein